MESSGDWLLREAGRLRLGHARYLAHYTAQRMNARVFDLYRELMQDRPVAVGAPA